MMAQRMATPLMVPPIMAPRFRGRLCGSAGAPVAAGTKADVDEDETGASDVEDASDSVLVDSVVVELAAVVDGADPIVVGDDSIDGEAVRGSDWVRISRISDAPDTAVATLVASTEVVPHPNW